MNRLIACSLFLSPLLPASSPLRASRSALGCQVFLPVIWGGLLFSAMAIVVSLGFCVCAPIGSACFLWAYRQYAGRRERRLARNRRIDQLIADDDAKPLGYEVDVRPVVAQDSYYRGASRTEFEPLVGLPR